MPCEVALLIPLKIPEKASEQDLNLTFVFNVFRKVDRRTHLQV